MTSPTYWCRLWLFVAIFQVTTLANTAPNDALLAAAQAGDRGGVVRALANGAQVDSYDADGWTALTYAAASGNSELVKLLIQAKADPNRRANEGVTPLFAAVFSNNAEVVKSLIVNGARVEVALPNGKTPLALAKERRHTDIVKILQAALTPRKNIKSQLATAVDASSNKSKTAEVALQNNGIPDATIRAYLIEIARLGERQTSIDTARQSLDVREQQVRNEKQRVADAAQERYETCVASVKQCEADCGQRGLAGLIGAIRPGTGRGTFGIDSQAALNNSQESASCRLACAQSSGCETLKP